MKQTKRIVYELGPSFKTQGGISSVLHTYYLHYAKEFDMRFIPTYSGNSRMMDLVFFITALIRVFFICLSGRKNIFHIHSSTYGSYIRKSMLAKICISFGCKVLLHIHGADFDSFIEEATQKNKKRITKLLNEVDRVIVLSESWKKFFSKYVSSDKILVIYNPIQEIKASYSVKTNNTVKVLFMGRMGHRKGTYDLVEAVRLLAGRNFKLELYGDGENKKIKALVEKYKLQNNVGINGWVPHSDVIGIYDSSDILVLPSYSEGLPMSVIEAMGRGLPVVTTDVGGITEAVTDGYNGFIIKSGDIGALAARLKVLISDGSLREEMGRRSLEIATEKFSVENVGIELRKALTEIE